MVANKEIIKKRIEETLSAFKDRLEENERKGKEFWSDDSYGEGLQNKCEGLEAFLIPHLAKPKELLKYLPTETLKKSIEGVYKTVNEKGFIPTPYESYKDLITSEVEPPEFIDAVSYTLTASIHAKSILTQLKVAEADKMLTELIEKSIKWLVDNHIPDKGWSGFNKPKVTHIYSTWSAIECLSEIRTLESFATGETLERIKEFTNIVPEVKEWLTAFAEEQQGELWNSDDFAPSPHVIYNLYGLDTLTNLEVDKTHPEIVERAIKKIIKRWDNAPRDFLKKKSHYPRATNKRGDSIEIEWEDESVLIIGISALSKIGGAFKESTIEYETGIPLYEKINKTLEKMFYKLNDISLKDGLWTDEKDNFSIYMTERIIEALLEYKEFLSPPVDVSLINEKIDSLIEMVSKADQEAIIAKLDTMNGRIDNLVDALIEVTTKLGGEQGEWVRIALEGAASKREEKKK